MVSEGSPGVPSPDHSQELCRPVVKRLLACLLAAFVVVGLSAPVAVAAPRPPKVVLIVGPVGPGMTDRFRAQAVEAAQIARRYTPDVVEVYSPYATWPAVRKAIQGASVVVYMGHGNGWPSKYRDSPFPPTQNGFGLNPVAGGGDSQHQYFGEASIRAEVKLAANAVVLLHHLCYASGNTEPGLPEGTLAQARQRVDNYASGFIEAGAAAVIADAWSSPAYLLRSVLDGERSIDRIWRGAPNANGNVLAFKSQRSPGYVAQMDPDRADSGFHRSIVLRAGLASKDVLASARGNPAAAGVVPDGPSEPSLVATGITVDAPKVGGLPSAGSRTAIRLPFEVADRDNLPDRLLASVRWDPIEVSPIPTDPATEVDAAPAPSQPADPTVAGSADDPALDAARPLVPQPQTPVTTDEPPIPDAPPDGLELVQPERLGDVVQPVIATYEQRTIRFPVRLPEAPGLYRLTVTLHDSDRVAYDAATQAMLAPMLVRVVGAFDARVLATSAATLEAGSNVPLEVRVANLGSASWGRPAVVDHRRPSGTVPAEAARVVGYWLSLDPAIATTLAPVTAALPAAVEAGSVVDATLELAVPVTAGQYLLLLDVVTPESGSLAAGGLEPSIVRVTVTAPR